jgi:hypothetical protein
MIQRKESFYRERTMLLGRRHDSRKGALLTETAMRTRRESYQ